jgi:cadmium resistance protein CadD (predicted permease)
MVFTVGTVMTFVGVLFTELWWIMGGVLIICMGIMFAEADDKRRDREELAEELRKG